MFAVTATGFGKLTCYQPEVVSPVKVAVASPSRLPRHTTGWEDCQAEPKEQQSDQKTLESLVLRDLHSKHWASPTALVRGATPSREADTCL